MGDVLGDEDCRGNKPLAVLAVQGTGHGFVSIGKLVLAQFAVSDTPVIVGYGIKTVKVDGLSVVGNGSLVVA